MQSVDYSDLVADAMDSSNQHMREAFTAIQRRETPLQQTNSSEDSDQRGQDTEYTVLRQQPSYEEQKREGEAESARQEEERLRI